MDNSRASLITPPRSFLANCATLLTERIGADEIEGIFVCGSVAAGEETITRETPVPTLLSDVDLVVILKSIEGLKRWYGRRDELGSACESLMSGLTFAGRVDVGLLLSTDLAALPPRPGVYDMRRAGIMLQGERRSLDRIPDYSPAAIDGREAVILIENRIASMLGSYPREIDGAGRAFYECLYQVARVYADVGVAALCLVGRYEPGYARRYRSLSELAGGRGDALAASLVSAELLSKIELWTRFKIEPSVATLGGAPGEAVLRQLWIDAARDILWFWRQANTYRYDQRADLVHPFPVEFLLAKQRRPYRWRDHLRSWIAFLSTYPTVKRVMLAVSLGRSLFNATPLDVVRERGVRLLSNRLAFGDAKRVPGRPFGFPHGGGEWEGAGSQLSETWRRIVFGRKA